MHISWLRLFQFRNYEQASLCPARGITVLHGANAQGKTNVIEAVYLCCVGRSHRTAKDAELIRWGQPAAQVAVQIERREGVEDVSVRIGSGDKKKKTIKINGSQVTRIGELMGHVNAVLFSPEDLRLVKDGPDERRRFLNMEISQLQPAYFYALQRYMRALHQRNGLLRQIAQTGNTALMETLDEWDALLVETGTQVIDRRLRYLEQLAEKAGAVHDSLSSQQESLQLRYQGRALDKETFTRLLHAGRAEDVRRGSTTVGPHRDDYRIQLNGRDARAYASQGQQRTIALSLKLAEIEVMHETLGEWPILLLDDVMSELDIHRRKMLLQRIENVQTIITCTHLTDLGGAAYDAAYQVQSGIFK